MSAVFRSLGVLLVILGFADFIAALFLKLDVSEVWWSPLMLGGTGAALTMIGNRENKDSRLYKLSEYIVGMFLIMGPIFGVFIFVGAKWGDEWVDRLHWVTLILRLLGRR